ncbi:MAG: tryptophan--tRNA ligase [Clostridia bacterium]|nr:tryptophan--tRNA ligase [Clostridia bacterium]
MGKIILTGERPTGRLHLGHFIGSLKNRLLIQDNDDIEKFFVMIADTQALTDNADNVDKVKNNIIQVALDNLSIGLNPNKVKIFIQSQVPQLSEITCYFMNLVTVSRLYRNPTTKDEIHQRGFENRVPAGFLTYPVSQAADILGFNTDLVPVGDDQLPMIELAREIARTFNNTYGNVFKEPKALVPKQDVCARLPGIDGKLKMSKSAGNCIYLSDEPEVIKQKVMSAYTDPDHIKVSDPGKIEGNVVFSYLDAFVKEDSFKKYLNEYENLDELKAHYQRGGLGDVKVKLFLNNVLQELLEPFRNRRKEYEKDLDEIYRMLFKNGELARQEVSKNLERMKSAMGLDYEKFLIK